MGLSECGVNEKAEKEEKMVQSDSPLWLPD